MAEVRKNKKIRVAMAALLLLLLVVVDAATDYRARQAGGAGLAAQDSTDEGREEASALQTAVITDALVPLADAPASEALAEKAAGSVESGTKPVETAESATRKVSPAAALAAVEIPEMETPLAGGRFVATLLNGSIAMDEDDDLGLSRNKGNTLMTGGVVIFSGAESSDSQSSSDSGNPSSENGGNAGEDENKDENGGNAGEDENKDENGGNVGEDENKDENKNQAPRYNGDLYAYARAVTGYFKSLGTAQEKAQYLGVSKNWFPNEAFRDKLLAGIGGKWPAVKSQAIPAGLTINPEGLYFNIYVAPGSNYAPVIYANHNESEKGNKWEAFLIYVEKDDSWYERQKSVSIAGLYLKTWDILQDEIMADPSWHKVAPAKSLAFLSTAGF
ncbi:MAG: hypothetical protein VB085_01100 [Peptococcaceae bacterium]|nr:hypothetical protein [Peptococcaceae bacterium]